MGDENKGSGRIQGLLQSLRQVREEIETRYTASAGGPNGPVPFWRRHLWQIIAGLFVLLLLFLLVSRQSSPQPSSTSPAVVVCSSGSTDSWQGWHLANGWKQLNNELLNDGTNGNYNGRATLVAPASCQPKTMDYAVEATIQVVSFGANYSGFGINIRSGSSQTDPAGYSTYIDSADGANISVVGGDSLNNASFNPGTSTHVYRAEVKGNTITFFIDGKNVLSVVDNRFISTGQVGLWCANAQIELSSFKVYKL
jgi:hypothetical protein